MKIKGALDMSILFKNAQIIDPTTEDVITNDLMVRDGMIVDPSGKAETVIDLGKYLAPGIVDIGVGFANRVNVTKLIKPQAAQQQGV